MDADTRAKEEARAAAEKKAAFTAIKTLRERCPFADMKACKQALQEHRGDVEAAAVALGAAEEARTRTEAEAKAAAAVGIAPPHTVQGGAVLMGVPAHLAPPAVVPEPFDYFNSLFGGAPVAPTADAAMPKSPAPVGHDTGGAGCVLYVRARELVLVQVC